MSENKNAKTPADDGQPVAWIHNFIEGNAITHIPADIGRHPERWTPLYTAPSKQWVGLTDGEIDILSCEMVKGDKSVSWLCKVLESKLKEKNT